MLSTSKALFRKPGGGAAPTTDATFAYVPLLLETGSASSRSTTVTDSSASLNTVTRVSNPSTGWVSPYQTDGYWGNQFNGSSDYLSIASSSNLFFGTKDYTFECWIYMTTVSGAYQTIFGASATGGPVFNTVSGTSIALNPFGSGPTVSQSFTFVANTWYHIAFTRATNVTRVYVNGNQLGSNVTDATNYTQTAMTVASAGAGQYFPGYISNLRILLNTALYTGSTLTVPTAPLTAITNTALLTCQSNRFKDNGTANSGSPFTLTVNGTPQVTPYFYPSGFTAPAASPGAALFNGTSQYLTVPSASALGVSSSDFTVEAWVYFTDVTGYQIVFDARTAQPSQSPLVTLQNTSRFQYLWNGVSFVNFGPTTLNPFTWYHVAIVRASGVHTGYVNGVSYSLSTTDSAGVASAPLILAARTVGGTADYLKGYLGNFRFVKGTPVYTGAFTPPSGPLTRTGGTYPSTTNVNTSIPSANTSLLLAMSDSNYNSATNGVQNNTFIDESNYAFPITRNGTPTQGSITPYWPNGQWSNYFNGSSSALTISTSANAAFQFPGNLTVEAWIYPLSFPSNKVIFSFMSGGGSTTGFDLGVGSDGKTYVYRSGGFLGYGTVALTLNNWNHVALVRNGSTFTQYLNGNTNGTFTNSTNFSDGYCYIARNNYDATTYPNWYISNARVVKGTAVYTSAFTPPTTPLTAITNTSLLTCQSNRFIDNSTNNFTITLGGTPTVQAFQPFSPTASYTTALYGGSGYFNGSTDYLTSTITAPNSSIVSFECWVYNLGLDGTQGNHYLTLGTTNYVFSHNTGGIARWRQQNDAGTSIFDIQSASGVLKLNQWQYMVGIRSGSNAALYVDGVRVGTATGLGATTATQTTLYVSSNQGSGRYTNGYLSNVRIQSGTLPSGYDPTSTTIAVPTTPLAAVTGTLFLGNMTNAGIYDAAAQNDLITGGTTQASTTITPKWPPSSMRFNGANTDYLYAPVNSADTFGSGNWTIEGWFNFSSVSGNQEIFSKESLNAAQAGIRCVLTSSRVQFQLSSNGSTYATTVSCSTVLTTGVWYYLAFVRNANAITVYLNGTSDGTGTFTGALYETNTFWALASRGLYSVGTSFNGYIQDFRITKGVARTITASPTAAFPTR